MPDAGLTRGSLLLLSLRSSVTLTLCWVSHDATKSHMARGRVDRLCVACGWAIAPAIVGGAQVRAAFQHLAGDLDVGQARVVARLLGPSAGVLRNAACLRRIGRVLGRIPIGGPLPHVADHVVDAVAV